MNAVDRFTEEFQRGARSQSMHLSRAPTIVESLNPAADEQFVNVFAAGDSRELLIVSSICTYNFYSGMLRIKRRWAVPHSELQRVRATRASVGHGYVVDSVLLETERNMREFRFGFNEPSYVSEVKREIASHNAGVAAQDIRTAAEIYIGAQRAQGAVDRVGADDGINYFSH